MHQAVVVQPDHSPREPQDHQPANAAYSSFLHDIIFVCCGTIGAAYLVLLIVGVPIAMIYIGFSTRNKCPAEPMIPIYLLICGSFSIFRTVWYFMEFWLFRRHIGVKFYEYADTVMCVLTSGMATLYLFGLYWVIRASWPNLENPGVFNYCDPAAFLLALITIIGVLVLILFWCMCVCTLAFQVVPVVNEKIAEIGIPVSVPPQQPSAVNSVTILVVGDPLTQPTTTV